MDNKRYKNLEDFIKALNEKGITVLDEIYLDFKSEFLAFGRKYNISEDDLGDIYQDTILAFYENIVNGKLTTLTSTIKTYVFSIGKYGIYNRLKKANKTISFEKEHIENLDLDAVEIDYDLNKKSQSIKKGMEKLGERCRKMLVLFYYHSYTIEALMQEFDYKNENVVRSHKSRCLKNLKTLIKEGNLSL